MKKKGKIKNEFVVARKKNTKKNYLVFV